MLAAIVYAEFIVLGLVVVLFNAVGLRRGVRTPRGAALYVLFVAFCAWQISRASLDAQSRDVFLAIMVVISTEIIWARERQRNRKKPFLERAKDRSRWLDRVIPGLSTRYSEDLDTWERKNRL